MKPLQSFLCSGGNALWVDISQFPTPFKEEAHKHSALGGGSAHFSSRHGFGRGGVVAFEDSAGRIGRTGAAHLCASLSLKTKDFPRVFAMALYYSTVTSISAIFLYPKAPVPPVTNFRVVEEGPFSLKVAWTPPLGKLKGYKVYIPRGEFRLY